MPKEDYRKKILLKDIPDKKDNLITWKNGKSGITTSTIISFEKKINNVLPVSYKNLIRVHDGGSPKPNIFDADKSKGRIFDKLLTYNTSVKLNIFSIYEYFNKEVDKTLVPFAKDPDDNLLCFYFIKKNNPVIVL